MGSQLDLCDEAIDDGHQLEGSHTLWATLGETPVGRQEQILAARVRLRKFEGSLHFLSGPCNPHPVKWVGPGIRRS
jgi:hypothetical protein